jgi:hypothetical protein
MSNVFLFVGQRHPSNSFCRNTNVVGYFTNNLDYNLAFTQIPNEPTGILKKLLVLIHIS